MSKLVALSDGQMTLVDDWNYLDVINAGPWHYFKQDGYARRWIVKGKKRKQEKLHQFIAKKMKIIGLPDHKNGDGLDNREENLREATASQSSMNRGIPSNNSSSIKGVYELEEIGKYRARIWLKGKGQINLGCFPTLEEAKEARHQAEIRYFGQFRREDNE